MNSYADKSVHLAEASEMPSSLVGIDARYGEAEDRAALIDFVELRAIVTRNRWWIVATVIAAIAAAAILTALAVPMYRAATSLEVDARQSNVLDVEDVQAEAIGRDNVEFLQTQLEILRSRTIAQAVAEDLGLLDNDDFLTTMDAEAPAEDLDARAAASVRREKVIDVLLDNQAVELVPQSRIIEVSFVSPSNTLAAKVANSYAQNYIENNLTKRFNVSSYARKFVGEQLQQARENLEESEKKLNDYARGAGLVTTSSDEAGQSQKTLTNSTIDQMNEELVDAQSDRIQAEQAWRAVANTPPLSIPTVYSNSAISALLRRRAELRAELAEANTRYVDGAAQIDELRSELAQIESELNNLAAQIKGSIRRAYEASVGRERQIQATMGGLTSRQQDEQNLGVQYNILNREVATNRALYDGLLQRYRELTASAGLAGNNITIIDEASAPREPFSPKPIRNLLLALLLGLVLAAVVAFLREQILQRVRTPEDVRRFIKLPLLAAIPRPVGSDIGEALQENLSNVSEAMATLTSVLSLSSENGAPASLFITSTKPAEGKSSTNFAVARNLARRGARVLAIDADMRRPNLHNLVGMNNEDGFSEVLTGQKEMSEVIKHYGDGVTIDVITAGHIPPNPVDLLSSHRFRELLARVKSEYDHVIFDGPPVLGLSDALIIASSVDATILAVESNELRPSQVRDTVQKLRASTKNLIGVVLTKFDARRVGYEYYYAESEYEYYKAD